MIIINEINNLRLYAASILAPMNSPGRSSSRLSEWRLAPVHHPLVYLPLLLKRLLFAIYTVQIVIACVWKFKECSIGQLHKCLLACNKCPVYGPYKRRISDCGSAFRHAAGRRTSNRMTRFSLPGGAGRIGSTLGAWGSAAPDCSGYPAGADAPSSTRRMPRVSLAVSGKAGSALECTLQGFRRIAGMGNHAGVVDYRTGPDDA